MNIIKTLLDTFQNISFKLIDGIIRKLERLKRKKRCLKEFDELRNKKDEILKVCLNGYKVKGCKLIKDIETLKFYQEREIYIGEIDKDGFVYSNYNLSEDIPSMPGAKFIERDRIKISLVVKDGVLGVKKMYGSNIQSFINEIKALKRLIINNCNVPTILDIDFEEMSIIISYIRGKVIREELAKSGAKIRDCEIGSNPKSHKAKKRFVNKRINEGKKYLFNVIDNNYIKQLETEIDKHHYIGVINNDIKYQNLIIENTTKEPYIIDFESSWVFNSTKGWKYKRFIKRDKFLFNKHFKN